MDNSTHQITNKELERKTPKWLSICAQLISIILHPLFIPTYVFLFLMQVVPYEFAGITSWQLTLRLFSCFWYTAFFPAIAIFLLWRLQFIQSILLKTQKERIVPFIIVMFFYWWMYYLSRNFTDQPIVLRFFYMGIFLSTVVGLILNSYFKISLHGMGAGGGVAALILFSWYYALPLWPYIAVAVFLAGLITTARLIISDHSNREIYTGLVMGMLCQLLSYIFLA
ncbi:MAG: hypothetical protein FGM61_01360 [Sediminibacterium sp.]|nr:hypothetical protein [Sediminibacterium sp.]